jgi:hypothetical protein
MNPARAVLDHLPEHIAELEAEVGRLMQRVHEIHLEQAKCQTLLDLFAEQKDVQRIALHKGA